MSIVVTTFVAALSAFAAVATVLVYLYAIRRSDLAAAREEALALAETRRQVIGDLEERLKSLEKGHRRATADCERRVRELMAELETTRTQARDEAYQTQHFYAEALAELLNDLRSDLERTPPDVQGALEHLEKLGGERPAA
jgi:biopolymer transport protein ExbB/TolQ